MRNSSQLLARLPVAKQLCFLSGRPRQSGRPSEIIVGGAKEGKVDLQYEATGKKASAVQKCF